MPNRTDVRKYKRGKTHFDVTFLTGDGHSIVIGSKSSDISIGGMKIFSSRELVPSDNLLVLFTLPYPPDKMEIPSTIIWSKPSEKKRDWFEAGLRFSSVISNEQKENLAKYVSIKNRSALRLSRHKVGSEK
ncbi:MAG: PilZ domain-containing protein [Candidatus Omnitrophica bacterium]|nr:PilZ domain-containing protein [Candidatus Omnitrophota bacterium]